MRGQPGALAEQSVQLRRGDISPPPRLAFAHARCRNVFVYFRVNVFAAVGVDILTIVFERERL